MLDGRIVAEKIKKDVIEKIKKYNLSPKLAVCLIGDDLASKIYVRNKRKACGECGIGSILKEFSSNISQTDIENWIDEMNRDLSVSGILIQLPLPVHLDTTAILSRIVPHKDVDCLTPTNQGLLMCGKPRFLPCTVGGVVEIMKHYNIRTEGTHVVVINNTVLLGQPLTSLLSQNTRRATVTMCHQYTKDIKAVCLTADIIVTAVGKPAFRLTGDMVREGAIVLDVGIVHEGNKVRGDAVFEEVSGKASITPVPGGCGPVTVAMLLKNTVDA